MRLRYAALFARFGQRFAAAMEFTPGQLGPVPGEWVGAAGQSADTLLYFHGGGFIAGSPETHRALVGRLVEAGGVGAFSVRYRLAPEYYFPAAVRDGIDAYRALLAMGVSGPPSILAGDGAGGGLALSVALAARNAGLRDAGRPGGDCRPGPICRFPGWSMHAERRKSDTLLDWELLFLCARHYLRKSNPGDTYASPAFARLQGFSAHHGACGQPAKFCATMLPGWAIAPPMPACRSASRSMTA